MTETRPALAALLLALAPALSAAEERLTPPLVLDGAVGDGVWLYGQLNKGVLVYDDGDETNAYAPVDNNNSSTRAGIWLRTMPAEDFTFSFNAEGEWKPYSTGDISRVDDDVEWDVANLRKLEAIAAFEGYGALWAGQGSMATDASAEQDLSGTALVAYSSVGDSAGGQRFVTTADVISDVSVYGAFSNYDGLGRLMRLRYDTPTWRGFGLRTSVGVDSINGSDEAQWDVAAVYAQRGITPQRRSKSAPPPDTPAAPTTRTVSAARSRRCTLGPASTSRSPPAGRSATPATTPISATPSWAGPERPCSPTPPLSPSTSMAATRSRPADRRASRSASPRSSL
jgi:hypothetical protein